MNCPRDTVGLIMFRRSGALVYMRGIRREISGGGHSVEKHNLSGLSVNGFLNEINPRMVILPEMTPVIDLRAVMDREDYVRFVLSCPIFDTDLPDGKMVNLEFGRELAEFDPVVYQRALGFDPEYAAAYLAVPQYVELWRRYGARIGHVVSQEIVYEADGRDFCVNCGREVAGYTPVYCCAGVDCGCHGQSIEPCVCSDACWREVMTKGVEPWAESK